MTKLEKLEHQKCFCTKQFSIFENHSDLSQLCIKTVMTAEKKQR